MKASKAFIDTIEQFIISCSDCDTLFALKSCNPNKNIEDCVTYILNQVQKSGIHGFTDDEIYSMAKHYYIEEDIEVGNPINCHVVVNHAIQLTEEEIMEQRRKAKEKVFSDERNRLRQPDRTSTPTIKQMEVQEATLFNFD